MVKKDTGPEIETAANQAAVDGIARLGIPGEVDKIGRTASVIRTDFIPEHRAPDTEGVLGYGQKLYDQLKNLVGSKADAAGIEKVSNIETLSWRFIGPRGFTDCLMTFYNPFAALDQGKKAIITGKYGEMNVAIEITSARKRTAGLDVKGKSRVVFVPSVKVQVAEERLAGGETAVEKNTEIPTPEPVAKLWLSLAGRTGERKIRATHFHLLPKAKPKPSYDDLYRRYSPH